MKTLSIFFTFVMLWVYIVLAGLMVLFSIRSWVRPRKRAAPPYNPNKLRQSLKEAQLSPC